MPEPKEYEISTRHGVVFTIFAADMEDAWDEAAGVLDAEENGDFVWQVRLIS